jgi:hypothetical protein
MTPGQQVRHRRESAAGEVGWREEVNMGGIDPGSGIRPEDSDSMGQPADADADVPEHERDDQYRRTEPLESDPAAEAGLPEHEQDAQRGQDTGGQPGNP